MLYYYTHYKDIKIYKDIYFEYKLYKAYFINNISHELRLNQELSQIHDKLKWHIPQFNIMIQSSILLTGSFTPMVKITGELDHKFIHKAISVNAFL